MSDPNNPCIFCNIKEDEIIFSNELAISSFDSYPVSKHHVLIFPKRHVKDYFDLTNQFIDYGVREFASRNNIQNLLAIIGPPYMKNIHQLLKPSFTINPSFLTTIEEEQNEMQLSDSQIAILKTLRYQKKVFIEYGYNLFFV